MINDRLKKVPRARHASFSESGTMSGNLWILSNVSTKDLIGLTVRVLKRIET